MKLSEQEIKDMLQFISHKINLVEKNKKYYNKKYNKLKNIQNYLYAKLIELKKEDKNERI